MKTTPHQTTLPRAWYAAPTHHFLNEDPNAVIGTLSRHSDFSVDQTQIQAWLTEIAIMKAALSHLTSPTALPTTSNAINSGSIFFEFVIPRMGRRVDVILIAGSVIFAIEFKTGDSHTPQAGIEQVWDYALDLKNFHETSHSAAIMPLLITTGTKTAPPLKLQLDPDKVFHPQSVTTENLHTVFQRVLGQVTGATIDSDLWLAGAYRPTPTIIEAARALYARHNVQDILKNDAGTKNIGVTSHRLETLIDDARANRRKIICFVTGVPGAGKTLVGLTVATQRRDEKLPTHAVFLSGNKPLVDVLREALTRDEFARQKKLGHKIKKDEAAQGVKAFIQNVHHFRDEGLRGATPPADHVVIFDEAQRAWNLNQTQRFMKEKKKVSNFEMSEPQFLISYMDRHKDWAFIACLVGGGQEINTGEAGIGEWINAVTNHFPHWQMFISDKLPEIEYAVNQNQTESSPLPHTPNPIRKTINDSPTPNIHFDSALHLSVSMRSFRAENVSNFVKQLLDLNVDAARQQLQQLNDKYPIRITRDLQIAKQWLRKQARGTERYGLLASSKALRLKPHAIYIGASNQLVNPVHWFLNETSDIRSSNFLEDAAKEFQVQGLELDWTCLAWDADLRLTSKGWSYHDFKGNEWQNIKAEDRRRYTLNAYRVLLTRARQGMVIFIPPGDPNDHTRPPVYYDNTFEYLRKIGIQSI